MTETLLTPAEVAERLQIAPTTLRKWLTVNDWPHVKFGNTLRFTEAQVQEIIQRHTVGGELRIGYPGESKGLTRLSAARLYNPRSR